jgi:hypothetical protein
MHSALKLKTKPTAQRYAGGGITKLMPKFAEGSTVTQYTSNVPEYAKENYADLVGRAQALSQAPYQTYDYDRIAQFTDLQNQGFGGLASLGVSPYSQQAGGIASNAANQAMNSYYGPSGFSTYGSGPQQVGTYGSSPQQVSGPGGPSQVSAYGSGAPQVTAPNMSQVGQVSGPGGPSQVGTQSFIKPGTASAYMNPYMQNVVDTQTREAVRSDDVARGSRNAQAVSAGAFGGSRQAIQEAEANRNLQTKLGDIQATGSNAAYQQAQQQFNTEQQLGLQGQQANQNAGLTTEQMAQQAKLANQQTGMQGLSLAQQAQQANQNAALGYGSQFLQAQQSNQNAGLTTQQMQQQAALANQQAGLSFGNQYLQAQQANQTAGLNYGNQFLDAQKMAEASRQFGATYGMQGLQTGLQGATMLGGLGNDIFKQQQTAAASQVAGGTQQQQQIQSILDQQYNDYQRQLNNPYQQLGFMSDILRGTQGTTSSIYKDTQTQTASPSNLQMLAGLGSIASGIAGKAEGGSIGAMDGGLASIAPDDIGDFADGGIVGYAEAGSVRTPYGDDQRIADDRAMYGRWWDNIKDAGERSGAAIADTAALIPRGLAGAYDTAVVRPMRAAGLPAAYVSGHLTPEGASTLSGTPFYDLIRARDPQEPAKVAAAAAVPAKPGPEDYDPKTKPESEKSGSGSSSSFRMPLVSAGRAMTLDEMKAMRKEAGPSLADTKREGIESLVDIAAAERSAHEEDVKTQDELHKSQGIAGLEREKKIKGRLDEIGGRTEEAKNAARVTAGLAILMAKPGGKGWRGAIAPIAAGAKTGIDQFREQEARLRVEKDKLDDSLDTLQEVRRQEANAQGKEKAALKTKGNQLEVSAKRSMGDYLNNFGLKEAGEADSMFNAYMREKQDARNRQTQADVANQRANMTNARLSGISKALTPGTKEYEAAVGREADKIMTTFEVTPGGKMLTRAEARQRAMTQLAQQRQLAEAIAMGDAPVAADGWGTPAVRPEK